MFFEDRSYVPTLALRASEMNGMEYLPNATKDKLFPCFLLSPWVGSNGLEKSVNRIQKAYKDRHYFLDIDRDYVSGDATGSGSIVESRRQFQLLKNSANSYRNWIDFVRDFEWIYPCIQTQGLNQREIRLQIEAFQDMGRPYCMRIERDRPVRNIGEIVGAFGAGGAADFAIILEGGWAVDVLSMSAWFVGMVREGLSQIDASVPVIVSATSIPKMFSEYSGVSPVRFSNRELVGEIEQRSNRAIVIYGDWGSTRPRERREYASPPLDRVDYPTERVWYIARNKEERWDFQRAAVAVVDESGVWEGDLGVWGEEMIFQTASRPALGINTAQKNVAARVNIHLHRQAFFGQQRPDQIEFDEDWQD